MKVDTELLRKYNRPGPRYTSYPTAVQFTDAFGYQDLREEITATNGNGHSNEHELSLYFHIPFCKTLCYFCGCTRVISSNRDRIARYLEALKTEIRTLSGMLDRDRRVVQLHWGGGSPTHLSVDEIRDLSDCINEHFTFAPDAEVSIEIDPRNLTDDHLPVLKRQGFNRVSFGVQDLDLQVQQAVNRVQPEELNRQVIDQSRELGFDSINVDLIYGLPHQTVESFSDTLDRIVRLDPDRLAVFNYAHLPALNKHQRVIEETALPDTSSRLDIIKLVIERLTGSGYTFIGMDHFARSDDDLAVALREGSLHRNFQGYTTRAGTEVYAMGMSSISQLENVYAQNEKTEKAYCARVEKGEIPTAAGYRLNDDDHLRRQVIMNIMCNGNVVKADVEKQYDIEFDEYFADAFPRLKEFVDDNLLEVHPDRITLTEAGRLVTRNVAMAFDRYLHEGGDQMRKRFSRTI